MRKVINGCMVIGLAFVLVACTNQAELEEKARAKESPNVTHTEKTLKESEEVSTINKEKSTDGNDATLDLNSPYLYWNHINKETFEKWDYRIDQYPKSVESIDKAYLCSTSWYTCDGSPVPYATLVFYLDNCFAIGTNLRVESFGKYELVNDHQVKLYSIEKGEEFEGSYINYSLPKTFKGDEVLLDFRVVSDSPMYSEQLYGEDENVFFGANDSQPQVGEVCNFAGYQMVVEKEWQAVAASQTKFRKEPNEKSETITVNLAYDANYQLGIHTQGDIENVYDEKYSLDYLLQSAPYTVIGRTKEKDQVDGKEGYWYYIRYYDFEYPTYGWIFENALPYQVEKINEYVDTYIQQIKEIK